MRDPGFYWVRRFHDDPAWTVAELCADGYWYTIGDSAAIHEHFAQIGEKLIPPAST